MTVTSWLLLQTAHTIRPRTDYAVSKKGLGRLRRTQYWEGRGESSLPATVSGECCWYEEARPC